MVPLPSGAAAGELADEQVVAIGAEVERGEGYSPGGVKPGAVFEAAEELAGGAEDVDVARGRDHRFQRGWPS